MNGFQEKKGTLLHKKRHKNGQEITQTAPTASYSLEMKPFKGSSYVSKKYCIYLRNNGIYKQIYKQIIWPNSLTEVENTDF